MSKILVVDDDSDQLDNLQAAAASARGREIVTAETAKEAIHKIRKDNFDAVITDLDLETKRAGLDVVKAAKERNVFTQVIVVTAYGTPAISIEAMKLGAFDYIERTSDGVDVQNMTRIKIALALEFRAAQLKSR